MKTMRGNFVGCQAVLWALTFFLVLQMTPVLAGDNVGDSGDDQARVPRLYFEPIAGLTTTRHLAPSRTAIPVGTALEIFLDAPEDAQVTFSGATITSRNADGIKATCLLNQVGPVTVAAISELSDGTRHVAASRLEVVSIAIGDISVTLTTPTVAFSDLNENATNEETMSAYFGGSIAQLVETTPSVRDAISLDGRRRRIGTTSMTRRFFTSISRRINFQADVVPPAFAPLMEWRIDGVGRALGAERSVTFDSVGEHTVSVGPPNRSVDAVIDTYSVSITSHVSGEDILPEGELITLTAVTDPVGFERNITWLSSTKYGDAFPVLGYGPTFTVQFDETWGDDPANGYFQWIGLRADNAVFGQDQKPCTLITEMETDAPQEPTWQTLATNFNPADPGAQLQAICDAAEDALKLKELAVEIKAIAVQIERISFEIKAIACAGGASQECIDACALADAATALADAACALADAVCDLAKAAINAKQAAIDAILTQADLDACVGIAASVDSALVVTSAASGCP